MYGPLANARELPMKISDGNGLKGCEGQLARKLPGGWNHILRLNVRFAGLGF